MEIVTSDPVEPNQIYDRIKKDAGGSVILHFAVVRGTTEGKAMASIAYQATGDVEAELAVIAAEVREKWKLENMVLIRRLGELQAGDIISLVAVSSLRSEAAFEACRYGVERLKKMSTIAKQEVFA